MAIYLLEKKDRETGEWGLCTGCYLFAGWTKKEADAQAKHFTEESVGIKFRARKYEQA